MAHPEHDRYLDLVPCLQEFAHVVQGTKDLLQDEPNTTNAQLEGRNMSIVLSPGKQAAPSQ